MFHFSALRKAGTILATLGACLLFSMQASAVNFTCNTSADFTSALANASLNTNDVIILTAGNTFTAPNGGFVLPAKTGTGWITIQSSALASLPPAGTRVQPSHAVFMPKIQPPGVDQAMRTTSPPNVAHHYKLIGLEFIARADNGPYNNWPLLEIGTSLSAQNTLALAPHHFIIDRCYMHANSATQDLERNIGLHGAFVDIIDCYISGGREVGIEGQCIWGVNGPGPFNIINNFLEGAGENIMFGGGGSSIPNMTPSDIMVQRNHFYKPMSWKGGTPHYAVKNHFELKCGRNVTVDSNLFENCWADAGAQYGVSITLKCAQGPSGQGSSWFTTENITITNNIVHNVGVGVGIAGSVNPTGGSLFGYPRNVTIRNNLFYDVNNLDGNRGWGFQTGPGGPDITIDHNTSFSADRVMYAGDGGTDHLNFVFKNNLVQKGAYSFFGSGASEGELTLDMYYPGCTFLKNVLKGASQASYDPNYLGGWSPVSLAFPSSWSTVLVDQANPGTNFGGYKVQGWDQPTNLSLYPYNNAGTDGADIGCDIDAVVAATAGCVSGVWGGGPPPPSGLIAYDGFNYTGSLNTQSGGSGFGNAWTTVSGQGNPALTTGSLTYSTGANQLTVDGNKLQPALTCQSSRNFASTITTANSTKWVSFRMNYTGGGALPSTHAGFALYPSLGGAGSSIFLGKPGSATNWGADTGGVMRQTTSTLQPNAFLLYKLAFASGNLTVSMWVNPSLTAGEAGLGASQLSSALTVPHTTDILSMKVSTGASSSNFQLDEFRIGNGFADVTPSSPVEVIVDNPAATLAPTVADWTVSTWQLGGQFEGSNYVHDGNTGKGSKTCTWTPNIPFTGTYQVYAKWTSNTDRTTAAPYVINHAGGLTGTITKNQQSNGGTWQPVGTPVTFNAGTTGYVRLSNGGTTGYVIADAVKFVKQ